VNRFTLLAFVAVLAPQIALADDAAPAAAADTAAPVDSLAPHTCKQPNINGPTMTRDIGTHDKTLEFQAYQTCMKNYVQTQQKLQQLHFQAGTAALKEFNDFIPAWNDYQNQPH
jgi:hypothetical protein